MNYYSEFDPLTAAWLRQLIADKLIPHGEVDERDIRDVTANDLRGYVQCHFFAGIGGWSRALALAGWEGPCWTGSCPCPPFSSAGKKKRCPECGGESPIPCPRRTGFFICGVCEHAWYADDRHLWPEFWRLIRDGGPSVVFGEQVASGDGRTWLSGVRGSLEILGYAVGCADLCAAGVRAPHPRQRLWWVADATGSRCWGGQQATPEVGKTDSHSTGGPQSSVAGELPGGPEGCGTTRGLANGIVAGLEGHGGDGDDRGESRRVSAGPPGSASESGGDGQLDDTLRGGRAARAREVQSGRNAAERPSGPCSMADSDGTEQGNGGLQRGGELRQQPQDGGDGFWDAFDIVVCRDVWKDGRNKARRVEPGTFPLASGISGRVGLLRGYGNSIVPQVASEFIKAYRQTKEVR